MLARQISRRPHGYELVSHPPVDMQSYASFGADITYRGYFGFGGVQIPGVFAGIFAPAWFVVLIALAFPAWWFSFERRRRVRIARRVAGLCVNCGYDLRASPERCPECGAVPATRISVPT